MALRDTATEEQNYKYPLARDIGYNSKIKFQAIKVIPPTISTGLGVGQTVTDAFNERGGREQTGAQNVKVNDSLKFHPITGEVADLFLPLSFQVNDGFDYAQSSLGAVGAAAAAGLNQAGTVTSAIGEGLSNFGESIANMFSGNLSGSAARLAAVRATETFVPSDAVKNAVSITARATMNPNIRTNFNGVSVREFNFAFKFIPRNAAESESVARIIKFFRFHSYPEEIGSIGSFSVGYNYPNMFKIRLLSQGENETFKNVGTPIKLSYLKSVSTSYNSTSSVLHDDGSPTEIDLNLNFVEYKALSRKDVVNEGSDAFYHLENGTLTNDGVEI